MICKEKLSFYVAEIENGLGSISGELLKFPSKREFSNGGDVHTQLFVEQAKKLLATNSDSKLAGNLPWTKDRDDLFKLFVNDIELYATESGLSLGEKFIGYYAQTQISCDALFHLARASILKKSYLSIDLLCNEGSFDTYSIPFKIRIALENKMKDIIGFESCDILRNNKTKTGTKDFPVTLVINELKRLQYLNLPCSLEDINNIYSWSCNFCHTAEKEYIWTTLKALETIAPLFEYEKKKLYETDIINLLHANDLGEEKPSDIINQYKGFVTPLCYFKDGCSVEMLEHELNNSKNQSLKHYTFHLRTELLDDLNGFYCSELKAYC